MAIDIYWGSGSPYSWRVLLAAEFKRAPYRSRLLEFAKQEHKTPQMLRLNPRGKLPVLTDGNYVCYESLAIMAYLDRKFPEPPMFGTNAEDAGTIMRVICEYQSYAEPEINKITRSIFSAEPRAEDLGAALTALLKELRGIESRLSVRDWLVGGGFSAADAVIFPGVQLLLRALERREAQDLRGRVAPLDANFPSMAAWVRRVEGLPGYDRTYPPHWRG